MQSQIPRVQRSQASSDWRAKVTAPTAPSTPIQSELLRTKNARWSDRSNETAVPSSAVAEGRRLYVGNLVYRALSEDVELLFKEGGFAVEAVDISTDPFTGRNPSYCFVDLHSRGEAERAMQELNGKNILSRPVRVNPVIPKTAPGNTERTNGRIKTYDRGWGGKADANKTPEIEWARRSQEHDGVGKVPYAFDRWSRNDASDHWRRMAAEGRRLYVGGLPRIEPQTLVNTEIGSLFKKFSVEAISKIISPHPRKVAEPGSHYYAFVDLGTAEEAMSAVVELDGQRTPWGGRLRVRKARTEREDTKVVREQFAD